MSVEDGKFAEEFRFWIFHGAAFQRAERIHVQGRKSALGGDARGLPQAPAMREPEVSEKLA